MPWLTDVVQPEGPIVAVEIGLSRMEIQRLRKAVRPVPAAVSLRALIDTGADCSAVEPRAVASLALPVKNITLANIPALGGLTPITQHDAGLTLVHPSGDTRLNLVMGTLLLAEVSLGALGYEVLIGRDVLQRCRFLYHGPRNRFKLAY